jgi:hypothetical protein
VTAPGRESGRDGGCHISIGDDEQRLDRGGRTVVVGGRNQFAYIPCPYSREESGHGTCEFRSSSKHTEMDLNFWAMRLVATVQDIGLWIVLSDPISQTFLFRNPRVMQEPAFTTATLSKHFDPRRFSGLLIPTVLWYCLVLEEKRLDGQVESMEL